VFERFFRAPFHTPPGRKLLKLASHHLSVFFQLVYILSLNADEKSKTAADVDYSKETDFRRRTKGGIHQYQL
jgi:hypothetical protein